MKEQFIYPEIDSKNYRKDENGWSFVHIEGSPRIRGYAYGRLMAKEIVQAVNDAKSLIEVQTGVTWEFFLNDETSIIHKWKKGFEIEEYHEFYVELIGIADGVNAEIPDCSLTCDDLILWNGYEELTGYWFPTAANKIYQKMNGEKITDGNTYKNFCQGAHDHCSAFMSQAGRPMPYQPRGAVDGVTADSKNALELSLWCRWGSSCGTPFKAEDFLKNNPQFDYLKPYLKDRPSQPWTKLMNNK